MISITVDPSNFGLLKLDCSNDLVTVYSPFELSLGPKSYFLIHYKSLSVSDDCHVRIHDKLYPRRIRKELAAYISGLLTRTSADDCPFKLDPFYLKNSELMFYWTRCVEDDLYKLLSIIKPSQCNDLTLLKSVIANQPHSIASAYSVIKSFPDCSNFIFESAKIGGVLKSIDAIRMVLSDDTLTPGSRLHQELVIGLAVSGLSNLATVVTAKGLPIQLELSYDAVFCYFCDIIIDHLDALKLKPRFRELKERLFLAYTFSTRLKLPLISTVELESKFNPAWSTFFAYFSIRNTAQATNYSYCRTRLEFFSKLKRNK